MADIVLHRKNINGYETVDDGTYIIDTALNTIYTVQDGKLTNPQKLSTLDTYILDDIRYKFNGDTLIPESEFLKEDNVENTEDANIKKNKKEKKIYEELKKISPTLYDFLSKQNAPISSMGALLPIILDKSTYFLNENTQRENSKLRNIAKWLKAHNFIDNDYNVISKDITLQDTINFASEIVELLSGSYTLDYKTILGDAYSNTISKDNISISELFSGLRSENKLNPSIKDTAIKVFKTTTIRMGQQKETLLNVLGKQIINNIRDNNFENNITVIQTYAGDEDTALSLSLAPSLEVCLKSNNISLFERSLRDIQSRIEKITKLTDQYMYITNILDKCSITSLILEIDTLKNNLYTKSIGDTEITVNKEFQGILEPLNKHFITLHKTLSKARSIRDLIIKNNPDKVSEYKTDLINNPEEGFYTNEGVKEPALIDKPAYSPIDSDIWKYFSNAIDKTMIDDILNRVILGAEPGVLRSLLHNLNNPEVHKSLKKKISRNIIQQNISIDNTVVENIDTVKKVVDDLVEFKKPLNAKLIVLRDLILETYTRKNIIPAKSIFHDAVNEDSDLTSHVKASEEFATAIFSTLKSNFLNYIETLKNLGTNISEENIEDVIQELYSNKDLFNKTLDIFNFEYFKTLENFIKDQFIPEAEEFNKKVDAILEPISLNNIQNKDLNKLQEFADSQSEEIVDYLEKKVTQLVEDKATETPDVADIDADALKYYSSFLNSVFIRNADIIKKTYTVDDLNAVLNEIYNIKDYTTKLDKSLESVSELSRLERLATKLIDFLNIDTSKLIKDKLPDLALTDIMTQLDDFLKSAKDTDLIIYLPKDIDIEDIINNKSIIAALIVDKVLGTQKQVMSVDGVIRVLVDNYNKNPDTKLTTFEDYLNTANKLFDDYKSNVTNNQVRYLLENAKFKIVIAVANTINNNNNVVSHIDSLLKATIDNVPKVENILSAISTQYKYRYLSENTKKAIANYKVIKIIESKITESLINEPTIANVLPEYIEYPDSLLLRFLRITGLYDLSFKVTYDPDILKLCKDVNIFKLQGPDYVTIDFNKNPFKKLLNRFKGINQYNPLKNALIIIGILTRSGYTKTRLERTFRYIESTEEFSTKLSSDKKAVYEDNKNKTLILLDKLMESAKEQGNAIENIDTIVNDIYAKFPETKKYIKIDKNPYLLKKPKTNETANIENILPFRVEIDTTNLVSDKKIEDISNNLRQLISVSEFKITKVSDDNDKSLLDNLLNFAKNVQSEFYSKLQDKADSNTITLPYLEKKKRDIEEYAKSKLVTMIKGTSTTLEITDELSDSLTKLDEITSDILSIL